MTDNQLAELWDAGDLLSAMGDALGERKPQRHCGKDRKSQG
jgi:hypothetical protein